MNKKNERQTVHTRYFPAFFVALVRNKANKNFKPTLNRVQWACAIVRSQGKSVSVGRIIAHA